MMPNAYLTGEVMLATLLRVFAAKVPILLSPVEVLVMFNLLSLNIENHSQA